MDIRIELCQLDRMLKSAETIKDYPKGLYFPTRNNKIRTLAKESVVKWYPFTGSLDTTFVLRHFLNHPLHFPFCVSTTQSFYDFFLFLICTENTSKNTSPSTVLSIVWLETGWVINLQCLVAMNSLLYYYYYYNAQTTISAPFVCQMHLPPGKKNKMRMTLLGIYNRDVITDLVFMDQLKHWLRSSAVHHQWALPSSSWLLFKWL